MKLTCRHSVPARFSVSPAARQLILVLMRFGVVSRSRSMFNASVMLLVAVTTFRSGHAQAQAPLLPPKESDRGGAIIGTTKPKSCAGRGSIEMEVRVLDILDGNQVLLSFGTDQGARKGQEGFLSTAWPERNSMPGIEIVELTAVGASFSIGRF